MANKYYTDTIEAHTCIAIVAGECRRLANRERRKVYLSYNLGTDCARGVYGSEPLHLGEQIIASFSPQAGC